MGACKSNIPTPSSQRIKNFIVKKKKKCGFLYFFFFFNKTDTKLTKKKKMYPEIFHARNYEYKLNPNPLFFPGFSRRISFTLFMDLFQIN